MGADVTRYLRCPSCSGGLTHDGGALRCGRGHVFDVARQGYVNLAAGPIRHPGDTAGMVAARVEFLAAGHYAFVADALADAARETDALTNAADAAGMAGTAGRATGTDGLVLDVGAGTGYHLARVLDANPTAEGLALDSSKAAARRAARAHPRAMAAVCDVWDRLPVADGVASVVLNVFAPRHADEFRRVLAPDGVLLVVTPAPEHLIELVTALGLLRVDPSKEDRLQGSLGTPRWRRVLRRSLSLNRAELRALVAMGPSAWHADPDAVDALPDPFPVTAAVRVGGYRR